MAKYIGFGAALATTTSTGNITIGQIRSIDGPDAAADDVDSTTLDTSTNYRTFLPAPIDPGEVTLELAYDPALDSQNRLGTLLTNQTIQTWTLTHPSTASDVETFSGYVKGIGEAIPLDDLMVSTITIKVTGTAGFSST